MNIGVLIVVGSVLANVDVVDAEERWLAGCGPYCGWHSHWICWSAVIVAVADPHIAVASLLPKDVESVPLTSMSTSA